MRAASLARTWGRLRVLWDRLAVWVPVILMSLVALGTYWLARNTPNFGPPAAQRAATHDPDYFMRRFAVRSYDLTGRLKSEIFGVEARHFPDTDTIEIDRPRIRSFNERGELTLATSDRALSNGDGSEVQLIGNAVVIREAGPGANGQTRPKLEIRSEFLHAFMNTERLRSHKPVVLTRGGDQFTADSLDYDNLDRLMALRGRVRGTLMPSAPR
jgi:lipopolysaccharide export system protein LptC